MRLVLELKLFLGLGSVSLWPLDVSRPRRLGLVPGPDLGPGLGELAQGWQYLRLGAVAAQLALRRRPRRHASAAELDLHPGQRLDAGDAELDLHSKPRLDS